MPQYDYLYRFWTKNVNYKRASNHHESFLHRILLNSMRKEEQKMSAGYGYGGGFALIVVLFVLLIIVGASFGGYGGGYGY